MNGICLFINEYISILKFLNSRFTFEDFIKENRLSKEEQMSDYFFHSCIANRKYKKVISQRQNIHNTRNLFH